jgi:hypothetical protein
MIVGVNQLNQTLLQFKIISHETYKISGFMAYLKN